MNLSEREQDYCRSFIKNIGDDKLICKDLNIAKTTAFTHRQNIYSKLYVNTKHGLMYYLLNNYWKNYMLKISST